MKLLHWNAFMEIWLYLQNLVLTIMSTQPNVRSGQPMVTVIVFLGWKITVPSRVTCVVQITVSGTQRFHVGIEENPYSVVGESVHTIYTWIFITDLAKNSYARRTLLIFLWTIRTNSNTFRTLRGFDIRHPTLRKMFKIIVKNLNWFSYSMKI